MTSEEGPIPDYETLEQLIMEKAGWRRPDDYPESLFHYTSSEAFLNILFSDQLWFSDFRYLNDLSELRYGVDLFKAALNRSLETLPDANIAAFFAKLDEQFDRAMIYTDVFVFCMCAENNLLNQWRVYGQDRVPIAIEFATRGFMFEEWEPYKFDLVPMVYKLNEQERIVGGAISAAIDYAIANKDAIFKHEDDLASYVQIVASICVDLCTSMKHPQFEVEQEWRLSTRWGLEHRDIRGRFFRSSPAGIVPYLRMRLSREQELACCTLPIKSVTIGPCSHPEIQQRTLRELLYQRELATVEVHVSNLPVRI